MFDPLVNKPDADVASRIVWFDAFATNVDRTARNPNLLMWHRREWLIDHGASLYFHHTPGWIDVPDRAADRFPLIGQHVLRHRATRLERIDEEMARALTPAMIDGIVAMVPGEWLAGDGSAADAERYRGAYARYLRNRLAPPRAFVEEAARAR